MPELAEVENFRRLLLPLVSTEHPLELERCSLEKSPPRKFITDDEITDLNERKMVVADVVRKGKLICMILKEKKKKGKQMKYLFLHMGMTGRVSNPDCIPKLQELSDTEIYPPPYTYLRLTAGPKEACFSDPRKFGAVHLKDDMEEDFKVLAPDAWKSTLSMKVKTETAGVDDPIIAEILEKLTEQSMGIKGVLLDQKRAVCGVGNWIADEVMYQCKMHPDQNYLTQDEAKDLLERLHYILDTAVQCLYNDKEFPREWLFHYRWSKRGSKNTTIKDAQGRSIVFVTSGGRTSAVVPSLQKKKSRKPGTSTTQKKEEKKKPTKSATKRKRAAVKKEAEPDIVPSEVLSDVGSKKAKSSKSKKVTTRTSRKKKDESAGEPNGASKRRSPRLAKS